MTDNKKRAGVYKSLSVKTSDFLPSVFQTNVNKRWLDSTLDQMVSKGDLKSLEGYFGQISGKCATSQDPYLSLKNKTALSPAIVTRKPDGTIDNKLLFSDIESANRNNFSEYNYNSAYASSIYGYHPPIDVDKFLNFINYYWIEELPVYVAEHKNNNAAINTDPIQDCYGNDLYQLVDDNNTFMIDNNMLIKFEGDGWDERIRDNTYIITGVGDEIHPYLYRSASGKQYYSGESKSDVRTRGYWDRSNYCNVSPNKSDSYWEQGFRTPEQVIQAFNTDVSDDKLPIFEGFIFSDFASNPEKFTVGQLIKLSGDWDVSDLERAKIFYTTYDEQSNTIDFLEVIGATLDANNNISTFVNYANIGDNKEILQKLEGWDKEFWDSDINKLFVKDYHVIAKNDGHQTAWSRNNNWTHMNTVKKLYKMMPEKVDLTDLLSTKRNAKRPIIEFLPYMVLWNFAANETNRTWIGLADFMLDITDQEYVLQNDGNGNLSYAANNLPVPVGSIVVLLTDENPSPEYQHIFRVLDTGRLEPVINPDENQVIELENKTVFVKNVVNQSLIDYEQADLYFKNGKWNLGQQKTRANQPPLFQLYYYDNTELQNFSGSSFKGSKVFGYKIGTGEVDSEVGLPLSYKDNATGAEYEFENFILTQKQTESFTSSIDHRVSHFWNLPGFYFFKIKNLLKTVYDKNEITAGTKQKHVYEITESKEFKIPFGYDNWRTEKEAVLHLYGNSTRLSEIVGNGVYLKKERNILIGENQTLTLHNLVHYNNVTIRTANGYNLENPPVGITMPDIQVSRSGQDIILTIGNTGNTTIKIDFEPDDINHSLADFKVFVNKDFDNIYHTVLVNGKPLTYDQYSLYSDNIVIPSELLNPGDLVDFEYYSNSSVVNEHTSLPDNLEINPTNKIMETFTIGETIEHWKSIMANQPGITGDIFGINNYNEVTRITNIGGNIEIHADISAMHDLNYSNDALDVTGALITQGADWDSFIERFKNQVTRIHATKSYTSVFDLVVDAIDTVVLNRKGSKLYSDSNMLFGHKHNLEKIILTDVTNKVYYSKNVFNGDDNIRDHVYVYLTDDRDNNGKFIQRLLTKDVDYTIIGNRIDLKVDVNKHATLSDLPYLTVSYHQMDEKSFVPPSPVKLKLQNAHVPQIIGNQLLTHDGKYIDLGTKTELDDVESENFNPVAAARFDLEKRIYAGLVSVDTMYGDKLTSVVNGYTSAYKMLPSQHRETWYTLDLVNEYLEKFFQVWARERNITEISPENYYNNQDPKTWNYSTNLIGEHFTGNRLPGHWTGAYFTLFGTDKPDVAPWHMLGHTFKPTWWDSYYSWTDPAKRQNLLTALRTGIIGRWFESSEDNIKYQDPVYARYYWDWETKCPVDTSGNLVSPELVLGTPSELNRAQPFEFGDWGPVEQKWRNSAQGYMALVDAVVKLNPARGWSEFFQPGANLVSDYLSDDINLYTKKFPTIDQYPVPGKIYNNVIKGILFENTQDQFSRNSTIRIANGSGTIESKTAIGYQNESTITIEGVPYSYIKGISVVSRGRGYTGTPSVLTSFTNSENQNSNITVILDEVPYVASGISQAQYNFSLRQQKDIDLDQVYSTVDVQLSQQLNGFTSKHLLNMFVDSSIQGHFRVSEGDYNILMHQNYPSDFVSASQVNITKTATGYIVSGVSSDAQEFKFYEPDLRNANTSNVSVGNTTIRKHKTFAGNPSTVQYGAKFSKIQDTYNFIRGYWHYMELNGYEFAVNGDAAALEFVKWALKADNDSSTTLSIGNRVKFTPVTGSSYEYNNFRFNKNNILDANGIKIGSENLSIDRVEGTVNIKTKNGDQIGSITSAVVSYEHVLFFNNTTTRGLLFNSPEKSLRYDRIYVSGRVTDNWQGERKALGYLVFDDHIVENFDSSVSAVDDYYRTDVAEFNPGLTKTKDLTIGNIDRDWISGLGLDKNTVTRFYQGVITESGTHGAIDKIARTDILDHGTTKIDVAEQYMFNQSYFGENKLASHIEVQLSDSDISQNPQIIKFGDVDTDSERENLILYPQGSKRIVHAGNPNFETIDIINTRKSWLSAGDPLETETTYRTLKIEDISQVFDKKSDYATIKTWWPTISYKLGDLVRHQGHLYKCKVSSTGLLVVDTGVSATGTVANPVFTNGTVANIAGTTTEFNNTSTLYNDIVASGTVSNPTLDPTETLVIDNKSVTFTKTTQQTVVVGDAVLQGNISNPSIINAEGESITINGVLIDFNEDTPENKNQNFIGSGTDITPPPVVETITGVLDQQTYTISQPISNDTYNVSNVSIDGNLTTDYTVNGQNITFDAAVVFTGGEQIEIIMVHQPLINLQDIFTITVVQLGTVWVVASITIDGVLTEDYNVVGQDIIFNFGNEPQPGEIVRVTIEHIPASFNTSELVDKINSKNIPGVTASITTDGFNRLQLSYTTTDPESILILGASVTNLALGFDPAGKVARPPSEVIIVNDELILDEVINQINSSNIENVTASKFDNKIVLLSTKTTLELSGTALDVLGLNQFYSATTSEVPTSTNMVQAVQEINNTLTQNNITDVTIVIDNNRIKITSENNVLDFGDTGFNIAAGLPTGEVISSQTEIENEFKYYGENNEDSEWTRISDQDPALFSVWVTDDSSYEVNSINNVQTKFYGWNVLQAQNVKNLFTQSTDGSDCGICAGTATSDGNDAEVTTNVDHDLQVGDYVMLLNTTTTPNIDGIHRVTKLGSGQHANRIFYIDRFIDECGNAASVIPMRPMRFLTPNDMQAATVSGFWKMMPCTLAWTNYNSNQEKGTYVYNRCDENIWKIERSTVDRVTNGDIRNAVIYDADKNQTIAEFEVFDPIRGIIPGVADRELNWKTTFDPATYNTTTDEYYTVDEDDCWAEANVGERWWDTSKVLYFDYTQGSLTYRAEHWGKQFDGSEIVVWEWTKSTKAPDDYAKIVEGDQDVQMFGQPVTGEPYSVYDPIANETIYYYTKLQEWNATQGQYNDVYYFWVKNKTTIVRDNHVLSVKALAEIIDNPTNNGIGWIAAISEDSLIISNSAYYLNDTSTVLQINKNKPNTAHNNWMLLAKGRDIVPEYWYIGLRNNLAGMDAMDEKIPNRDLHPLNRYGDDRSIGQAWFNDLRNARYNAVLVINDLLKDINLLEDLKHTWDKTLKTTNQDGVKILPDLTWRYTAYQNEMFSDFIQPTHNIKSTSELDNIDTNLHEAVYMEIFDNDVDRSETYYLVDGVWHLVKKNNSTIEFDAERLSLTHGWDTSPWDAISWDNTFITEYWRLIVDACRNDLFVGENLFKFNKLFFAMVEYTLSKMVQVNWVHKSTYVSLYVERDINTESRKYKRDQLNEVIGYINTVKPFHTKISNKHDIHKVKEQVNLTLEESNLKKITLEFKDRDQNFVGTIVEANYANESDAIIDGGSFTQTEYETVYDFDQLFNPYNYTNASVDERNQYQSTVVDLRPVEHLSIKVQTNETGSAKTANTRTFVYVQDRDENVGVYALVENTDTTIVSEMTTASTTIELQDGSNFANNGFAYVGNEIIKFDRSGNTLYIIDRSLNGSFAGNYQTGTKIIDVTNAIISTINNKASGQTRFNQPGMSLLQSSDAIAVSEIILAGAGMEI